MRRWFEIRSGEREALKVIWEVWENGNDFPVVAIDTRGAAEDSHDDYARVCLDALNGSLQATSKDGTDAA